MTEVSERIAELRRELATNQASRQFYQLGELLRREGRTDEAIAVLRQGLRHHQRYVAAWVSLGRACLDAGGGEAAAAALKEALGLDSQNPVAWRLLGEARLDCGDRRGALSALEHAMVLVPGDEVLQSAVSGLRLELAEPPAVSTAMPRVAPGLEADGGGIRPSATVPASAIEGGVPAQVLALEPLGEPRGEDPFGGELATLGVNEGDVFAWPEEAAPLVQDGANMETGVVALAPGAEVGDRGWKAADAPGDLASPALSGGVTGDVPAEVPRFEDGPFFTAGLDQDGEIGFPAVPQAGASAEGFLAVTDAAAAPDGFADATPSDGVPGDGGDVSDDGGSLGEGAFGVREGELFAEPEGEAERSPEPEEMTVAPVEPLAAPREPRPTLTMARLYIQQQDLATAAGVLRQLVGEQPRNQEAADLLDLVQDMMAPLPETVPRLSLKERRIAALQRWAGTLSLGRERLQR